MAQIEDVAGTSIGAMQNPLGALSYLFPLSKEQNGIEISLHRCFKIELFSTFIERNASVEADDVRACFLH